MKSRQRRFRQVGLRRREGIWDRISAMIDQKGTCELAGEQEVAYLDLDV